VIFVPGGRSQRSGPTSSQLGPLLGEAVHCQLQLGCASLHIGRLGFRRFNDLLDIPIAVISRTVTAGLGTAYRTDFPFLDRKESAGLDYGGETILVRTVMLLEQAEPRQ